ncbi:MULTISPECIES: SpoVR family protein [unclassified Leisingera]|uniref:SpoVR family protein n=1 Tax=unclassified Leisingera TaxID=2614906 RepID=UPI0002D828D2|nr:MULTISPECIES: SpoVR family protein [unclassified Leisingera]KIC23490.1 SpoVR family protein [Leisingera sp. ANG-S3]KIC54971.1 SpoVR family protein [Leisingera sp. ANG-S]KID08668.1 SpoVR family protein [Leisingera sp. ANG1]
MRAAEKACEPLFDGPEWTFELMEKARDAIEKIALEDLGLDVYPNQIEIISAEQMLDAYSCVGLPLMYQHWSFGKHFARDEALYRTGRQGLAYEIVINSNPCISYNMEENTMAMQTLVMAHAAFGHNHFFKNNYLFQQWTDAAGIHDYLAFAKNYIAACEERYGPMAVEEVLDAAHAMQSQGVFRYGRPPKPTNEELVAMQKVREGYESGQSVLDIWTDSTLGRDKLELIEDADFSARRKMMNLPQENILYFLEKHSPVLEPWQCEILRIVRMLAQYLYPQKQTKVMNEGCATFVHYYIINKLHEQGQITQGAYMEMLHSHTNVVMQPEYDDPRYSGINPYALGFAMMQDIRRICQDPTDEDREWFPDFAGNPDWRGVLRDAWANYRDESFIQQFLSPNLIRKFKLFTLTNDAELPNLVVSQIHNRAGYKAIRRDLAKQYDLAYLEPDIQVTDADLRGDRELKLTHNVRDGIHLDEDDQEEVLKHLRRLWGYGVRLDAVEATTES